MPSSRALPLGSILFVTLSVAAQPAAAAVERYAARDYRLSISGRYVNHYTIDDPGTCGPVGDGNVTVDFRYRRAVNVKVAYDGSRYIVAARHPRYRVITFLSERPVAGTLSWTDNTTPRTPPDYDCEEIDKSGCGSSPLRDHKAGIYADAGEGRRMRVSMSGPFRPSAGGCGDPAVSDLAEAFMLPYHLVGGDREGRVPVTMPPPRKFFRRRRVSVTEKTHRRTSEPGTARDAAWSTDITRTVTVTFTRR
jgi:hypothetical protein